MADLALALGFIGSLLAIGIGAAMSVSDSVSLWVFEACCLIAIGLVVILELRPRFVAVRARVAALRRFRRQLADLPEVPHPLDQVARPRPSPSG